MKPRSRRREIARLSGHVADLEIEVGEVRYALTLLAVTVVHGRSVEDQNALMETLLEETRKEGATPSSEQALQAVLDAVRRADQAMARRAYGAMRRGML